MLLLPEGSVEAYLSIAGEGRYGGGSTEPGAAVLEAWLVAPAAMAGAGFDLELVDLSQFADELEEEDEGENDCGENEEMTARSLFIDFAG